VLKSVYRPTRLGQASQPTRRPARWTDATSDRADEFVREKRPSRLSDDAACRRDSVSERSVCRSVRRNRTPLISRTAARDHGPTAFRNGERASRARHNKGKSTLPPGPFCPLRMLECTASTYVIAYVRDNVSEECVARQFTSSLLPLSSPPPSSSSSWLEDRRLSHDSRICNPAACRTIAREYVYAFIHSFSRATQTRRKRVVAYERKWSALDYCFSSRSFSDRRPSCYVDRAKAGSLLVLGANFDQEDVVLVAVESPASRIPRTFTFHKPVVYEDRLLIVQGQRQYINGPRIKWQQRGVVEHNPT